MCNKDFYFSWFGLVSLFNDTSNFIGYLMPKPFLVEEQLWYYLTNSWGNKCVHTFSKNNSPTMNTIAQLEFEHAYYNLTVQHISHYITGTPPFLFYTAIEKKPLECVFVIICFSTENLFLLKVCYIFEWTCLSLNTA